MGGSFPATRRIAFLQEATIAEADDYDVADGSKILSFGQAQKAARS